VVVVVVVVVDSLYITYTHTHGELFGKNGLYQPHQPHFLPRSTCRAVFNVWLINVNQPHVALSTTNNHKSLSGVSVATILSTTRTTTPPSEVPVGHVVVVAVVVVGGLSTTIDHKKYLKKFGSVIKSTLYLHSRLTGNNGFIQKLTI
jgi:hypothetical protein